MITQFKTDKGIFRLVGSTTKGIDTWKNDDTREYFDWTRQIVEDWAKSGRVTVLNRSLVIQYT